MPRVREMQVKTLVLAQKEIAKGHAAILTTIMVVRRTAADHQSHLTERQNVVQEEYARPIGHRLHTVFVTWPARTGTRHRQNLDLTRFQAQVQQ